MQTILKTPNNIKPNQNKTLPIGAIQIVKQIFEELHLLPVLDNFKHRGHSLSKLIIGMVSYKMTENHSTIKCHQWINNNPFLLTELQLDSFGKDVLYRGMGKIGLLIQINLNNIILKTILV